MVRRGMNPTLPHHGFTLIELIVSMALVGVIAAVSFSILFFGQTVFGQGQEIGDLQADTQVCLEVVSSEIRNAGYLSFALPTGADASQYNVIFVDADQILKIRKIGQPTVPLTDTVLTASGSQPFSVTASGGASVLRTSLSLSSGSRVHSMVQDTRLNNIKGAVPAGTSPVLYYRAASGTTWGLVLATLSVDTPLP